jgi:hypothetical protein
MKWRKYLAFAWVSCYISSGLHRNYDHSQHTLSSFGMQYLMNFRLHCYRPHPSCFVHPFALSPFRLSPFLFSHALHLYAYFTHQSTLQTSHFRVRKSMSRLYCTCTSRESNSDPFSEFVKPGVLKNLTKRSSIFKHSSIFFLVSKWSNTTADIRSL